MRFIDPKWTDLAAGHAAVFVLQNRLEREFGRAVKIGHERRFQHELSEWQKKRRIFFVLAAIAPLSVAGLCVSAYYFREVACVIVYWAVVVLTILVTLAVAGRNFIKEMMNRPERGRDTSLTVNLEERWWDRLKPQPVATVKARQEAGGDFLAELAGALPDDCLAVAPMGDPAEMELLVLAPSGIWIFAVRGWSGTILRLEGTWRQVRAFRDRWGRKRSEEQVHTPGPDDRWLERKNEVMALLQARLPELDIPGLVNGGVVFSHPKAAPDKARISGQRAAYGPAKAWVERLRRSQPVEALTLGARLQILDGLHAPPGSDKPTQPGTVSAQAEAGRIYQEAAAELRIFVAHLVEGG